MKPPSSGPARRAKSASASVDQPKFDPSRSVKTAPASPDQPVAASTNPYSREALNAVFESGAVPERAQILESLADSDLPMDEAALAKTMKVRGDVPREGLRRRLSAMERDGQIVINRKGAILVAEKTNLVSGRVEAHPDGFGFVVNDEGEDLFLAPREMDQVFHGDRVLVRPSGFDRRGRTQGAIVEVLERAQTRVVGKLHREHGVAYLVASDRRISQDILIEPDSIGRTRDGQIVTVEIVQQPSSHAQPIGRLVEVLGGELDPGMEIEIALRKHQLPFEFSAAALAEAKRLPETVRKTDLRGRLDLRDRAFVTIDGENSRDFDDAVFCERSGAGFSLWVAIADVDHYVPDGSALDRDAIERGTSVYFPRRVIPMLPEKISNGLCSLNPQVDRLVLACEMNITRAGKVAAYRFHQAVICSHARLTYTQVAQALDDLKADVAPVPAALEPQLALLNTVYKALAKQRVGRGAIDFSSRETEFDFDDSGRIAAIRLAERNEAYKLIEECMLAANVCAAAFLSEHEQATLYRNHAGPTTEKLETVRTFLKPLGLQLAGGETPGAKDYRRLIESIRGRPDAPLIEMVLLRSMQQARYAPDNIGHFGLAYEGYLHFTSPIRRYPDLLAHRGIKAALAGTVYRPGKGGTAHGWKWLGEQCSLTERRADDASRDVTQWLKCYFMRDRVGECFNGVVSAVTSFGIFVSLDGLFIEGLVHISELGNDYFDFDATRFELRGSRANTVFRLGQAVRVEVARVDLESARIDFSLAPPGEASVSESASTSASGRAPAKRSPSKKSRSR